LSASEGHVPRTHVLNTLLDMNAGWVVDLNDAVALP
jgi:hypothetical protein